MSLSNLHAIARKVEADSSDIGRSLHKFFGVSTIYIVNRDESEVEAVVKGFTDSPIPGFEPTIVHAKTAAQAQELDAVGKLYWSPVSSTVADLKKSSNSLRRGSRSLFPSSYRSGDRSKGDCPGFHVSDTTARQLDVRLISSILFLTCRNKPEPGVMLEMCYAPKPWTDLAKQFQSNGWKVVTGDQAMIWQGVEVRPQSRLFS